MDQENRIEIKANTNPQEQKHDPNSVILMLLGKVFIAILIASLLVGAGFYLGRKVGITDKPFGNETETPKTDVSNEILNEEEEPLVPSAAPTNKQKTEQNQTINIKAQGQSFSLLAPMGWQSVVETENYTTRSTISDGKNSLIIMINMATEGAPCGFKDSPLSPSEMFPDVSEFTYENYTEFKDSKNQNLRRVDVTANPSAGKNFFTICQKRESEWSRPTDFGFITYELPYSDSPETTYSEQLSVLDSMVSSMKPI